MQKSLKKNKKMLVHSAPQQQNKFSTEFPLPPPKL